MLRVLFVCVHNSARSQMAEELLRLKSAGKIYAESAGLEPGKLNPIVVDVLKTVGIDISKKKTQNVFELYNLGKRYNYVITVCDESNSERCPIFPGAIRHLHWSFTDPSSFKGTYEEKFNQTNVIMHQIEEKINSFLDELYKTNQIQ